MAKAMLLLALPLIAHAASTSRRLVLDEPDAAASEPPVTKGETRPELVPTAILFRHRKTGSSWLSRYVERLVREDLDLDKMNQEKEHCQEYLEADEALSVRPEALQAVHATGNIVTITSIRNPVSRYLSEASHCGPLATCSGNADKWTDLAKDGRTDSNGNIVCSDKYPTNPNKTPTKAMWAKWREAGNLGCPLTGEAVVLEDCVNGTELVTDVMGNATEVPVKCRSDTNRWPRGMYIPNYYTRRMMGDPACKKATAPVKFVAYEKSLLDSTPTSSAYFADQSSLFCDACPDCKCSMMRELKNPDLDSAKASLDHTDIVVVEEDPASAQAQFDYYFPSPVQRLITAEVLGGQVNRSADTSKEHQAPAESELPEVYDENRYDMELWRHAKELSKVREATAKSKMMNGETFYKRLSTSGKSGKSGKGGERL